MAVPPPPASPKEGTVTAVLGDNTLDITIPSSESWRVMAIAMRNQTRPVRCRVYIGDSEVNQGMIPILDDVQSSTDDYITGNWDVGMPAEPTQEIRFEWKSCQASDVLEYRLLVSASPRRFWGLRY